jgi:hypothetical protein
MEPTNDCNRFSFDCAIYRKTKREMLTNGWDEVQIFGRSEIDVDTAILGWIDPQDGQPVSTWTSRTVNKVLNGAPLPLRLASTFLLTKMMRVRLTNSMLERRLIIASGLFGQASRT